MSPSTAKGASDAVLLQKVANLNEELKKVKEQNAMYSKKWEKLKESAKKKRESKGTDLSVSTLPDQSTYLPAQETQSPPEPAPTSPAPSASQSMYFSTQSRFS